MRHSADRDRPRAGFQSFLQDEALLAALLGALLVGFLSGPRLRASYDLPELRLVLTTLFALAGGLVALLSATRFSVERRSFDLLLCGGFLTTSVSLVAFTVGPAAAKVPVGRHGTSAAVATAILGWALLASASFVRGRAGHSRAELWSLIAVLAIAKIGRASCRERVYVLV